MFTLLCSCVSQLCITVMDYLTQTAYQAFSSQFWRLKVQTAQCGLYRERSPLAASSHDGSMQGQVSDYIPTQEQAGGWLAQIGPGPLWVPWFPGPGVLILLQPSHPREFRTQLPRVPPSLYSLTYRPSHRHSQCHPPWILKPHPNHSRNRV